MAKYKYKNGIHFFKRGAKIKGIFFPISYPKCKIPNFVEKTIEVKIIDYALTFSSYNLDTFNVEIEIESALYKFIRLFDGKDWYLMDTSLTYEDVSDKKVEKNRVYGKIVDFKPFALYAVRRKNGAVIARLLSDEPIKNHYAFSIHKGKPFLIKKENISIATKEEVAQYLQEVK